MVFLLKTGQSRLQLGRGTAGEGAGGLFQYGYTRGDDRPVFHPFPRKHGKISEIALQQQPFLEQGFEGYQHGVAGKGR